MKAVLDTVVFVRALLNPHNRASDILLGDLALRYTLVLSPAIVEEIIDVLYRPSLRLRFPQMADPPRLQLVLSALELAEIVEPETRFQVCRDPGDDKFLDCAVQAEASYVVSEDRDLLDMQQFRGIRMVSVAEFVALLAPDGLR